MQIHQYLVSTSTIASSSYLPFPGSPSAAIVPAPTLVLPRDPAITNMPSLTTVLLTTAVTLTSYVTVTNGQYTTAAPGYTTWTPNGQSNDAVPLIQALPQCAVSFLVT